MQMTEFDVIFLSYDENNAEKNWSNLLDICPWAKRVHGVKGFDAAHRVCAEKSDTDWLITVDADNIVRPEFFDYNIDLKLYKNTNCYSWNATNSINGLSYGNGGLKLWKKNYLLSMSCHELSDDNKVDFCWENGYRHMTEIFSDVYNNSSPYQAFRVGFREGVKLSLDRGKRITGETMSRFLHPFNLRNLRVWSCVGSHIENGIWAMYGARLGWKMMLDMNWNHSTITDYEWFNNFWNSRRDDLTENGLMLLEDLGDEIKKYTKISIPILNEEESLFFREMI